MSGFGRFLEFSVRAPDILDSLAFYRVLGFRELDSADIWRHKYTVVSDGAINIGLHDRVSGASKDPYRFMPHLGVADIHEVAARLSEAGVEFIRQPEQESWGGWVATFRDPDGNTLQLLQLV